MARGIVSQHLVEVLLPSATASPTTPTGAGISQHLVEVLGSFPGRARVAQHVIEVLMVEDENQSPAPDEGDPGGGGGGTRIYGWAG
jgi:hypothetical protein